MDEEGLGIAGLAKQAKRDRIVTRASLMVSPLTRVGASGSSREPSAARLESYDAISDGRYATFSSSSGGQLPMLSPVPASGSWLDVQVGCSTEFRNEQRETANHLGSNSSEFSDRAIGVTDVSNEEVVPTDPRFFAGQGRRVHAVEELTSGNLSGTEGHMEEVNGMLHHHDQLVHLFDQDPNFLFKRGLENFERLGDDEGQNSHADGGMSMLMDWDHNFEDARDLRSFVANNLEDVPQLQAQCQPFAWFNMQNPQSFTKIYRKRPKVLSSQQYCAGSTQGPFPAVTLGSVQSSEGDDQEGSSLPWQNESQEPMESDDGGREEGDDNNENGEDGDGDGGKNHESRMDLTDDLLHMVFSFLDQTALCQAAMVCRQWRFASGHEDFWRSLDFEGRRVTQEQVRRLCGRYPRAVDLNLKGVSCVDELVREAMHSLRCLEKLTLGKGNLSDTFFNCLAIECPALQQLTITDAMLGICGSQEIQVRHDSLRRLQVTKCRVMRMAIRCPLLDVLSLKRTSMASAMLHCPRLLSLDVSSCHKLSDAGVRAAATACPSLISLDIRQCSYVSDETLREISAACPSLRILDASYCPNISLEGVRMPMLTELKLHNCEGINSSSMTALSHCFMLESIQLDFCLLLTAVNLDLPRLQSISLVSCRKFVDLTLRSPSLVNINVATCPVLNRVEISSTALQKLVLQEQQSLTTLALQCPQLREVDLTECDSLTNSICEVFSEGGGCPRLNALTLDNCESLTMVKLSSTSLKTLSLVGCRKICSIELACPNIQQLHLDGCDHLTTATLSPVGLRYLNLGICPRLAKLKVEAPCMTSLDLKGCGVLCQADILCPQLQSLDAFYCSRLEDECLEATTTACPLIQSLILASCPSIGPAGLSTLQKLSNLTLLDLSYTFLTDLSPIFETCPRLKVLRLLACKYLGDAALDALHGGKALPDLRELDLSYGSLRQAALEGLIVHCPHLTHVSLNGCANLYDLDWESKPCLEDTNMEDVLGAVGNVEHLQEFHATNVGLFEGSVSVVEDVTAIVDSKYLCSIKSSGREISDGWKNSFLSEQIEKEEDPSTADHLLQMSSIRALQHLNCVGCPNIKKVVIPFSAGCQHLSSLNLSLSSNVKVVRLACYNLTSLNLSNCTALEELTLACPRLVSLSLQASGIEAGMLECSLQGCSSLETLDVRNCSKISAAALSRIRAVCPRLKRLVNTIVVS